MDYTSYKALTKKKFKDAIFDALDYVEKAVQLAKDKITVSLKNGEDDIELKNNDLWSAERRELYEKQYAGMTDYLETKIVNKVHMWLESLGYECAVWTSYEAGETDLVSLNVLIISFKDLVDEFDKMRITKSDNDSKDEKNDHKESNVKEGFFATYVKVGNHLLHDESTA